MPLCLGSALRPPPYPICRGAFGRRVAKRVHSREGQPDYRRLGCTPGGAALPAPPDQAGTGAFTN